MMTINYDDIRHIMRALKSSADDHKKMAELHGKESEHYPFWMGWAEQEERLYKEFDTIQQDILYCNHDKRIKVVL